MKRIFFLFFSVLLCLSAKPQSKVSGYVYDDINNNGKKDRKEQGIAGVAVSNGREVTVTDSKGFYSLPLGNDNIIFVIKPEGYQVPHDANNLPRFYYIHKPESHPEMFRYKTTSPTGKLPKSVDFALLAAPESDTFTALVFGDPQPYNLEEIDFFFRGVVSEIKGMQGISFGISLGDLAGNNLDLHQPYIQAIGQAGIPWYNVMGNHDMNLEAPADSLADETIEMNFGPANYSFNYGKVHFIVLDDILYPDPRDGKSYWGGFRESQLEFIKNDLRYVDKDKLIVLAFHIPMYNDNSFRPEDRRRLFELLKDYPYTVSLSAHTHIQQQLFYDKEKDWFRNKPHHEYNAGTTCGDWYSGEINERNLPETTMRDGTPQGYAFMRFSGNQYTLDYKVVGKPADYRMNIYHPKVVPHNKKTSAGIVVNFFMGSAKDVVEYRIDDSEWKRMQRIEAPDPAYLELLYRWDRTDELMPGSRPSNAVTCTHLWQTAIPTKLSLGVHTIEVKATDMFGRTFIQKSTYRVEKDKGMKYLKSQ